MHVTKKKIYIFNNLTWLDLISINIYTCLVCCCEITYEAKVIFLTDEHHCFCVHFTFVCWICIGMCVAAFLTANQTCTYIFVLQLQNYVWVKSNFVNGSAPLLFRSFCFYQLDLHGNVHHSISNYRSNTHNLLSNRT